MPSIEENVARLRKLQSELNDSIDVYIQASEQSKSPRDPIHGRLIVNKVAGEIASITADPMAIMLEYCMFPAVTAALRVAIDLDIFSIFAAQKSDPITATELSKKTGAEYDLIVRIMRVLTSRNLLAEVREETYSSTMMSQALTSPIARDFFLMCYELKIPTLNAIPAFLRSTSYSNPKDKHNDICRYLWNHSFWEHLESSPEISAWFNSAMKIQSNFNATTQPQFPYAEVLNGAKEGKVLVVDVGGGLGQVLMRVMEEYTGKREKGRFVLQELPSVVEEVKQNNPQFEVMEHDFFAPQPVKGARIYHLRRVLHDWPSMDCKIILNLIAEAMDPHNSKLLIHDLVLPAVGCSPLEPLMDLAMMTFSGMERREKDIVALLEEAGLKVVKIWRAKEGSDAIVEAELV